MSKEEEFQMKEDLINELLDETEIIKELTIKLNKLLEDKEIVKKLTENAKKESEFYNSIYGEIVIDREQNNSEIKHIKKRKK